MTVPPAAPRIYHITHAENLASILAEGGLLADRTILQQGGPKAMIGLAGIKRRRLEELNVGCHPGTRVGDYVPFYFCPRSVMLYLIHRGNHPELGYRGGQDPIVHLEADLHAVVRWAAGNAVRWAFSLSNAGARYTEFRARVEELDQLDWPAIAARDFANPTIKEAKQAEFLLEARFPFDLVSRIGVRSEAVRRRVVGTLCVAGAGTPVELRPEWYF